MHCVGLCYKKKEESVCERERGILLLGGLRGWILGGQGMRNRALGNAEKPITALFEKTRLEYPTLKADRTVLKM